MSSNPASGQIVDHLFRHESGKMIAVLTRIFGIHNLQLAEDVVQEAFLKATQTWKFNPLPENPSAWLMQVAKNKALDIIRRQQNFHYYSKELAYYLENEAENSVQQFFHDIEVEDSQLRIIFACCHPLLNEEDQIALTLKIASGFGINEIAKALLASEATIQKRIYRAKEFIRNNSIELEIPAGAKLTSRLHIVHTVLYLLFNEGYNSVKANELIRKDVCAEAMRLCLLLTRHKTTSTPSSFALLSLMCLQASRFDSRIDDNNSIILLENQDRQKWSSELISLGYNYLNYSAHGNELTVYHLESAIAAEHCMAACFQNTNWARMLDLYNMLFDMKPTATVILNRAVVKCHLQRVDEAIEDILNIPGIEKLLSTHYMYSAVLGDCFMKNNKEAEAGKYLGRALALTTSEAEKKLLKNKLEQLRVAVNGE